MKLHVLYVFNGSHFLFFFIISDCLQPEGQRLHVHDTGYGTAIPTTRTHGGRLSVGGPTGTRRPSPRHSV